MLAKLVVAAAAAETMPADTQPNAPPAAADRDLPQLDDQHVGLLAQAARQSEDNLEAIVETLASTAGRLLVSGDGPMSGGEPHGAHGTDLPQHLISPSTEAAAGHPTQLAAVAADILSIIAKTSGASTAATIGQPAASEARTESTAASHAAWQLLLRLYLAHPHQVWLHLTRPTTPESLLNRSQPPGRSTNMAAEEGQGGMPGRPAMHRALQQGVAALPSACTSSVDGRRSCLPPQYASSIV